MGRRNSRVRDLAAEARLDLDEVLVLLWDAEILYVQDANHPIRKRDHNRARRALGIATRRELGSPRYWREALNLTAPDFERTLVELGVQVRPGAKRLPKGAVAKLKAEARRRGAVQVLRELGEPEPKPVRPKPERLEWKTIGQPRELRMMEEEEVVRIHFALVEDFKHYSDPIHPEGVRSPSLLSSAVHRPRTSLGDTLKYPTVEMAAAALLHSLVMDHPFHNGNKRTALVAMLVFLDENKFTLTCGRSAGESAGESALFRLVLLLAQHRLVGADYAQSQDLPDREVLHVADWIRENSRPMELGDRPIQWRRLKRILRGYECDLQPATVGNRVNITREKKEKGFLGRTRTRTLHTQVYFSSDGQDAEENTVGKIRKDLHLDEERGGMDSRAFYESASYSPDDFIVKYSKLLKRLSRL